MKNRLLFLTVLLLSCFNCFAQNTAWLWGTAGIGGLNDDVEGTDIAVDGNSNALLTGFFSDTINIGGLIAIAYDGAAYVVKCDSSGNVKWVVAPTGLGYSRGYGVACDKAGNIYNAGSFEDSIYFGSVEIKTYALNGAFLAKYDANGNVKWVRQSDYSKSISDNFYNDGAQNVATDDNGNVYIIGEFEDSMQLGSSILLSPRYSIFIAKYDSSGNLQWVKQSFAGSQLFSLFRMGITLDKYKNIYITGSFNDSLDIGASKFHTITYNGFVAKLDSNGTVKWANQIQSPNVATSNSILAGHDGNIYVTGSYFDTLSYKSAKLIASGLTQDLFILKIDTAGNFKWFKSSGGINPGCRGYTVCMDNFDGLYIAAGIFTGTPDTVTYDTVKFEADNLTSDGCSVIIKLDTSGNFLCGTIIPAGGDDWNAMATNAQGSCVYLGGDLYNAVKFGPDSIPAYLAEVPFIARWKSCNTCDMQISVSQPPTLCSGSSDTLTATGGTSYTWNPSAGLSATTGSSVVANPTVSTTYVVHISSGNCVDSAEIDVDVFPAPNIPTISQNGDTLLSSAKTNNQWYENGTLIPGADSSYIIIGKSKDTFTVAVSNPADGCTSVSLPLITSGLKQISVISNQVSIYPNPTNGNLCVNISSSVGDINDWNLRLTDVLGQTIYTCNSLLYSNVIDLSTLAAGVYFITVTNKTTEGVFKVVKQ